MNSFEIWESIDKHERTLVPHDSPQHEQLTTDESGERMRLVKTFQAATWHEALEEFRKTSNVTDECTDCDPVSSDPNKAWCDRHRPVFQAGVLMAGRDRL
jgi:hypothetical protein